MQWNRTILYMWMLFWDFFALGIARNIGLGKPYAHWVLFPLIMSVVLIYQEALVRGITIFNWKLQGYFLSAVLAVVLSGPLYIFFIKMQPANMRQLVLCLLFLSPLAVVKLNVLYFAIRKPTSNTRTVFF